MTETERDEFIYDLALHMLDKTSKAGIYAHAVDRICYLLDRNTDEQLIKMAPDNLRTRKKKKTEPKGF